MMEANSGESAHIYMAPARHQPVLPTIGLQLDELDGGAGKVSVQLISLLASFGQPAPIWFTTHLLISEAVSAAAVSPIEHRHCAAGVARFP